MNKNLFNYSQFHCHIVLHYYSQFLFRLFNLHNIQQERYKNHQLNHLVIGMTKLVLLRFHVNQERYLFRKDLWVRFQYKLARHLQFHKPHQSEDKLEVLMQNKMK